MTSAQPGFTKYPFAMWGRFKPSTAIVFLALYSHAWMRDGARPSIGRVATMTGVNDRTVQRAISELVAEGEVVVTPRGDGSSPNLYTFPKAAEGTFTPFDNGWWSLHLTPREAMTLLALQHFSTLKYGAVPGCRRLATMTRVGKSRVLETVVPDLERRGVLQVDSEFRTWKKKRRSNSYSIVPVGQIVRRDLDVPEMSPQVPEVSPRTVPEMSPHVPQVSPHVPEVSPEEESPKKIDPRRLTPRKLDPGSLTGEPASGGSCPATGSIPGTSHGVVHAVGTAGVPDGVALETAGVGSDSAGTTEGPRPDEELGPLARRLLAQKAEDEARAAEQASSVPPPVESAVVAGDQPTAPRRSSGLAERLANRPDPSAHHADLAERLRKHK